MAVQTYPQDMVDAESGTACAPLVTSLSRDKLCTWLDNRDKEVLQEIEKEGGVAKVAEGVGSSIEGLPAKFDIAARQLHYGRNFVEPKKPKTYCELFWDAMHDATVVMLIISAVISLGLGFGFEEDKSTAWIEGVAITISVLVVGNVQAYTDWIKEKQFRELNDKNTNETITVVRGGAKVEISTRDVCVGDVVSFTTGNMMCADGLLVGGSDVRMDESALTGEPKLIGKGQASGDNPPDLFLLSGTKAMEGNGTFLVLAVGPHSVAGKIRAAVYGNAMKDDDGGDGDGDEDDEDDEAESSVLFKKLNRMAIAIGKYGLIVAMICVVVMIIVWSVQEFSASGEDRSWKSSDYAKLLGFFIHGIAILVVAVPEGLPLAVTLSLAYSVTKMQEDMNLVKHLHACETMGSATTICSDKTGTLTTNRMTVRQCHLGLKTYKHNNQDHTPVGTVVSKAGDLERKFVDVLTQAIALNSTSRLELNTETNIVEHKGNPTECALLGFCDNVGEAAEISYDSLRKECANPAGSDLEWGIKQFAFSSARKAMSWVVELPGGAGFRLYSKGASEIVLDRCVDVLQADGVSKAPLSDDVLAKLKDEVISGFADDGMRTLCLAYRDFDSQPRDWEQKLEGSDGAEFDAENALTMIGIVAIEDPLRPEVPSAIARCYKAGIDVRMVTGDNLNTAVSIAKNAGILRKEHFTRDPVTDKPIVKADFAMEGKEFRKRVHANDGTGKFMQAEFDLIWPKLRVLARSSPQDKLTLCNGLNKSTLYADKATVKQLKKDFDIDIYPDRQVVAMTGDGTNDAPALKRADVGFAMGIAGTSIARDACDIILMDDNFSSIVKAAMWGRNIYDSIQKFLQFQLTVNIAALTINVVGAFRYQDPPLRAVQMLWVNLIMDSLASLALATEPPVESLLQRKPYSRSSSLISPRMWVNMLGHAAYQVAICLMVYFEGESVFGLSENGIFYPSDEDTFKRLYPELGLDKMGKSRDHGSDPTVHFTLLFNIFVMCTLFNELNARKLRGETNVFEGMTRNKIFCAIIVITMILQVIFVEFAGKFVGCTNLSTSQWLYSVAFGAFSIIWQQIAVNPVANFILNDDAAIRAEKNHTGGVLKFASGGADGRFREGGKNLSYGLDASQRKKEDKEVARVASIRRQAHK